MVRLIEGLPNELWALALRHDEGVDTQENISGFLQFKVRQRMVGSSTEGYLVGEEPH